MLSVQCFATVDWASGKHWVGKRMLLQHSQEDCLRSSLEAVVISRGNVIPTVKMLPQSTGMAIPLLKCLAHQNYTCRVLCAENALIHRVTFHILTFFWGLCPKPPLCEHTRTLAFSHAHPMLHAVHLSASVSVVPSLQNDHCLGTLPNTLWVSKNWLMTKHLRNNSVCNRSGSNCSVRCCVVVW